MPEDNNTPSSEDARSTTGSPEMGTPEADERSATKTSKRSVTTTTTVDDFHQEIEELRKALAKANNDAKEHRLKAKELDEIKAAQMTEQEKLQHQHAELQELNESLASELLEARVHQEVGRYASRMNFILSGDMLAKLLLNDIDDIEFENGRPTNIEKLLEKLAKAEPDLVKQQQSGTQDGRPPVTSPNNPGRNNITQPGTQPGRIPTLDEYFRSHR